MQERESRRSKDSAVLCAKCEHLNPGGKHSCERCGAHLYIACKDCGARNPRVHTRCDNCSRRLHRSWLSRLENRVFKRGRKLTLVQLVLLAGAVVVIYQVIVRIAEYEPPAPP